VSKIVVEGDPQAVSQVLGSLLGESGLSAEDRELLRAPGTEGRVVVEARTLPAAGLQSWREKAQFLRAVEEIESEYMASGKYPAAPPAAHGAVMTYRTDGEDFTLAAGSRRYDATEGVSYGAPVRSTECKVQGFLSATSSGWGPWRSEGVVLQPRTGAEVDDLRFLEALSLGQKGSARMFFPVDRETCGYLFRRDDGQAIYSSGEMAYDSVSGSFSLKLFREVQAASTDLSPGALENLLVTRDDAVVLAGDASLLADLGMAARPRDGEEVVMVSGSCPLQSSVGTALDGLRLAALDRHKEVLEPSTLASRGDSDSGAVVVGKAVFLDKLGQSHALRVRAGRGANYDWVVGQICAPEQAPRVAGFVDSQAASYESSAPVECRVKAGQ
jgi:hypothetical protein